MKKIKIITIYTDIYKNILHDIFIPSIKKNSIERISIEYYPTKNATPGVLNTNEFRDLSFAKMELIHENLKSNFDGVLIFCDLDIIVLNNFIKDVLTRIKHYDLLMQDNRDNTFNCGFMVFNCNKKMLDFWEKTMEIYNKNNNSHINDQFVINDTIYSSDLNFNYLPLSYFCNYGEPLEMLPKEIFIYHAAWCDQEINKYNLLTKVKNFYHI